MLAGELPRLREACDEEGSAGVKFRCSFGSMAHGRSGCRDECCNKTMAFDRVDLDGQVGNRYREGCLAGLT